MQNILSYLLKVSICYAAVYLFYAILLRRVTLYTGNRFFLIFASLAAFFIPLLHFGTIETKAISGASLVNYIPDLTGSATRKLITLNDSGGNSLQILVAILFAGATACSIHLLIKLLSLKKITNKATWIRAFSGIQLYHLDGELMPFSFGNRVYVNEERHTTGELEKIIRHESVHVRQKHTFDVILMEFICILNWYNPFAWMMKKAVKQNLEFLADDAVIRNGADKKNYQYLLLKATGYPGLSLANQLSFSSLKNRIYMMNKARNSKKHIFKFLLVLPVVLFIILSFRNGDGKSPRSIPSTSGNENFQVGKVTYSVDDMRVKSLVEKTKNESVLQAGRPFTVTSMKNERDRLKILLEKNGYGHITNHTITFLVDSSLTGNSFAIQVNINLQEKRLSQGDKHKYIEDGAPPGAATDPLQAKL